MFWIHYGSRIHLKVPESFLLTFHVLLSKEKQKYLFTCFSDTVELDECLLFITPFEFESVCIDSIYGLYINTEKKLAL